jgi:hypothetical protein
MNWIAGSVDSNVRRRRYLDCLDIAEGKYSLSCTKDTAGQA